MRRIISLCALSLVLCVAPQAFADSMAGLQLKFGNGTDVDVQSDIKTAVEQGMAANKRFSFSTFTKTRARLTAVVRDCFTNDCLGKAGKAAKSDFGLRINFSGEAQIYDWTIDIYDLNKGKLAKSVKGSCELCGRAEVGRTFKTTLGEALKAVPKKSSGNTSVVVKEPKEEPKPDPEPDPIKEEPIKETPRVQVTQVLIDVEPVDAIILMNDTEVGRGSTTLELSPGTYNLQFKREGYQGFKESLVIGESDATQTKLRVHMSKTDPDPVLVRGGEGVVDRMDNRVLWGGVSLATGGILLVTGIILSSIDGQPTCSDGDFQDCPTVYATGLGGITLTTTGAVLATAGVGLLLWKVLSGAPEEINDEAVADDATTFSPVLAPGFSGVSIQGSF